MDEQKTKHQREELDSLLKHGGHSNHTSSRDVEKEAEEYLERL